MRTKITLDEVRDELLLRIAAAEAQLGPRAPHWGIGPVQINNRGFPLTSKGDESTIVVFVTKRALNEREECTYEVAHEAVHCLSPTFVEETLYFEEAVAVYFSLSFIPAHRRPAYLRILPRWFKRAYNDFRALKAPDPMARVKALREEQPNLDLVDAALLKKYFDASPELATRLCERLPSVAQRS